MRKNIVTKRAPLAIGPYSQAVEVSMNRMIFVSGQLPMDPVSGEFAGDGIKEQTKQSILNIQAILEDSGMSLNEVVRTTVYLKDMNTFSDMNEIYAQFFNEGLPARAAVEVACLPKNALVEISAVAVGE